MEWHNFTGAEAGLTRLVLVVGVAMIDRNGHKGPRVLLAQRPPGKANAGLWEFPGGKVRPGLIRICLSKEMNHSGQPFDG